MKKLIIYTISTLTIFSCSKYEEIEVEEQPQAQAFGASLSSENYRIIINEDTTYYNSNTTIGTWFLVPDFVQKPVVLLIKPLTGWQDDTLTNYNLVLQLYKPDSAVAGISTYNVVDQEMIISTDSSVANIHGEVEYFIPEFFEGRDTTLFLTYDFTDIPL